MTRLPPVTQQKVGEWLESRMLEEDQPLSKEEIRQQAGWKRLPLQESAPSDDDRIPHPPPCGGQD